MNHISADSRYTSRLPLRLRILYTAILACGAINLALHPAIYSRAWGIVFLILAVITFCFSTFISVAHLTVKAGVMGIPFITWQLADLGEVTHLGESELPRISAWLFGIHFGGVASISLGAGREAIYLTNAKTGKSVLVSAQHSKPLAEQLTATLTETLTPKNQGHP